MKKIALLTTMLALALIARADPPFHLTPISYNANGVTFAIAAYPPAGTNFTTVGGTNYWPDTYLFLHASPAETAWTAFAPVAVPAVTIGTTNPIKSEVFIQAWNSTQFLTVQSSNRVLGVASDYYPPISNSVGPPPPAYSFSYPFWAWLYRL